jgi:phospholipid transport system substrate-binding protein
MLTRRAVLATSAAALLLPVAMAQKAQAQADATAAASSFVQRVQSELAAIVNGPATVPAKRVAFQQIVDRIVDVTDFGRFCLGRFWNTATPKQQQDYITLFHAVLMNNLSSKISQYAGVSFTTGRAVAHGDQVYVDAVVSWPNYAPYNVQWVIGTPGTNPKIIDVIAAGTSMRLTQRNDYAGYLSHNGSNIDALIAAMRKQVSE